MSIEIVELEEKILSITVSSDSGLIKELEIPSLSIEITTPGPQGAQGPAGSVEESFESVSKNIKAYPYTLTYTLGVLTSITYDLGSGLEIVKTLNYTMGSLTSVVLSGDTPSGIDLTKTLNYTMGVLTSITYS